MRKSSNQHGVTLVELIFSLAILATLLSISVPALGSFIQGTQSRSAFNTLVTSLNLARAGAVNRQTHMTTCPSVDQARCTDDIWWQRGWIVFVDSNNNGKRDDDETILEVVAAQPGIAIATTAGRKYITYRNDGTATGTNLTYTFCDSRGSKLAKSLVVNNAGRVRQGIPTADQAAAACAGL